MQTRCQSHGDSVAGSSSVTHNTCTQWCCEAARSDGTQEAGCSRTPSELENAALACGATVFSGHWGAPSGRSFFLFGIPYGRAKRPDVVRLPTVFLLRLRTNTALELLRGRATLAGAVTSQATARSSARCTVPRGATLPRAPGAHPAMLWSVAWLRACARLGRERARLLWGDTL